MQIHYTKHHNTYVTNLNVAVEKLAEAQSKNDVSSIISLQQGIKFNGLILFHFSLHYFIIFHFHLFFIILKVEDI